MDPVISDISVSDLVLSTAGRDRGALYYCVGADERYVMLVNGKDRTLDKPKRKSRRHVQKVLRSETRVAEKLRAGDKVLNSELRRDLAFHADRMQSIDLLGG
jgi:ribosomal protein L14E/L6E/L27E